MSWREKGGTETVGEEKLGQTVEPAAPPLQKHSYKSQKTNLHGCLFMHTEAHRREAEQSVRLRDASSMSP